MKHLIFSGLVALCAVGCKSPAADAPDVAEVVEAADVAAAVDTAQAVTPADADAVEVAEDVSATK